MRNSLTNYRFWGQMWTATNCCLAISIYEYSGLGGVKVANAAKGRAQKAIPKPRAFAATNGFTHRDVS
jgi:hypothetical protein